MKMLQEGNMAPVDLPQASIGPGMAVFSQYAKVLEPDGSRMPVGTALTLTNQTLGEIPPAWDPALDPRLTVWEVAQHLIRELDRLAAAAPEPMQEGML